MNLKRKIYISIAILCLTISIILVLILVDAGGNVREVRVGEILTIKYDGNKFQAQDFVEVKESGSDGDRYISAYLEFEEVNSDSKVVLELSNNIKDPSNAHAGFNFIDRKTLEETLTVQVSDEINSQSTLYCRKKGDGYECGFWGDTPQVNSYPNGDFLFEQFLPVGEFIYSRITISTEDTIDGIDTIEDEVQLIENIISQ